MEGFAPSCTSSTSSCLNLTLHLISPLFISSWLSLVSMFSYSFMTVLVLSILRNSLSIEKCQYRFRYTCRITSMSKTSVVCKGYIAVDPGSRTSPGRWSNERNIVTYLHLSLVLFTCFSIFCRTIFIPPLVIGAGSLSFV